MNQVIQQNEHDRLYVAGPAIFGLYLILILIPVAAFSKNFAPTEAAFWRELLLLGGLNAAGLLVSYHYRHGPYSLPLLCLGLATPWPFILLWHDISAGNAMLGFGRLLIYLQIARNFAMFKIRDFRLTFVNSLMVLLFSAAIAENESYQLYLVLFSIIGILAQIYDSFKVKGLDVPVSDSDLLAIGLSGTLYALLLLAATVMIFSLTPAMSGLDLAEKLRPYRLWAVELWHNVGFGEPGGPSQSAQPIAADVNPEQNAGAKGGQNGAKENNSSQNQAEASSVKDGGAPPLDPTDQPSPQGGESSAAGQPPREQDQTSLGSSSGRSSGSVINDIRQPPGRGGNEDDILWRIESPQPLKYLSGYRFVHFDGINWQRPRGVDQSVTSSHGAFNLQSALTTGLVAQLVARPRQYYTLVVAGVLPDGIISLAGSPLELRLPGQEILVTADGVIRSVLALPTGTRIEVSAVDEPWPGWAKEVDSGKIPGREYLAIPAELTPQIEAIKRNLGGDPTNRAALITALQDYFQNSGFHYVRQPVFPANENPVTTFLLGSKAGNCMHFATATVLLLRSCGLKSRFVSGYLVDEIEAATHCYLVRRRHAHAWVEVFRPGGGWQTFDPTVAIPRAESDQESHSSRPTSPPKTTKKPPAPQPMPTPSRTRWWAIGACLAVFGVASLARRFIGKKHRDRRLNRPVNRGELIRQLYLQAGAILAKTGYPRDDSVAPLEYLENLPHNWLKFQHSLADITQLFMACQYGGREMDDEDVAQARRALEALQRLAEEE